MLKEAGASKVKVLIAFLLLLGACKGVERSSNQKTWQQKAKWLLGEEYESAANNKGDKVLVYSMKMTKSLSLFDMKWAVLEVKTGRMICNGKNHASKVTWYSNNKVKMHKAKEMVRQGEDNRFYTLVDLTNCKETGFSAKSAVR